MYEILSEAPPRTKILAPLLVLYHVCVTGARRPRGEAAAGVRSRGGRSAAGAGELPTGGGAAEAAGGPDPRDHREARGERAVLIARGPPLRR